MQKIAKVFLNSLSRNALRNITLASMVLRNAYLSPGCRVVLGMYSLRYFCAKKLGLPG